MGSRPVAGKPWAGQGRELPSRRHSPPRRPASVTAMTSPPRVGVHRALFRRAALDGRHGSRRYVPPSARPHRSRTSRPGPAQGTPGRWRCRPLTNAGHPRRGAQNGVDLDEQLDFLGERERTICIFAVHRRRRARPRHQNWLTYRQHLTGQSGVKGLQSVNSVGLVPTPENRAIRQHGRHLPQRLSAEHFGIRQRNGVKQFTVNSDPPKTNSTFWSLL